MRPDPDNAFDLLALARRGDLSETDTRRLRELLASSPDTRLLYEAGRAFDGEAPVAPGDDERVARIASRVQKRMVPEAAMRRRRWMVQACVAAALVTTGAVGALALRRSAVTEAPKPADMAAIEAKSAPTVATVSSEGTPRIAAPTLNVSPWVSGDAPSAAMAHEMPPRTTPPGPLPRREVAIALTPAAASQETASEIFSAANRARVHGDTRGAIALSRQLETAFPASPEAVTTHLSLGLLYLQEGNATEALAEFQSYRALGARETMPEAMWGESQALRQLGRTTEERATLEELLRGWPDAAYTVAARKRLAALP